MGSGNAEFGTRNLESGKVEAPAGGALVGEAGGLGEAMGEAGFEELLGEVAQGDVDGGEVKAGAGGEGLGGAVDVRLDQDGEGVFQKGFRRCRHKGINNSGHRGQDRRAHLRIPDEDQARLQGHGP